MNKFYNTYFVNRVCRYFACCKMNEKANKQRFSFTVGLGGLDTTHYRPANGSMYMWEFANWYKKFGHACSGQSGKSKETLSAEEIMSKLEDLDIQTLCEFYPMYEYYRTDEFCVTYRPIGIKHSTLAVFNVVDDWGVFRIIKRNPEHTLYRYTDTKNLQSHIADVTTGDERTRLLISPKGKVFTFISMGDTWMRTSRTSDNFFTWNEKDVTIIGDENLEKVEHLKLT